MAIWSGRPALRVLAMLTFCALPQITMVQPRADLMGEPRTALVIGNATYADAPLRNPINDARAIAAKLRELGFGVVLKENLSKREMERTIGDFGAEISKGGVGLFYYAGHGLQVRGRNFLIPIDARISGEASVLVEGVDSETVLEQMAAAGNGMNPLISDSEL